MRVSKKEVAAIMSDGVAVNVRSHVDSASQTRKVLDANIDCALYILCLYTLEFRMLGDIEVADHTVHPSIREYANVRCFRHRMSAAQTTARRWRCTDF